MFINQKKREMMGLVKEGGYPIIFNPLKKREQKKTVYLFNRVCCFYVLTRHELLQDEQWVFDMVNN